MRSTKTKKSCAPSEMDFKPFMNLMVVLIPILLISAEFARVSIIDMNIRNKGGTGEPVKHQENEKLNLTAIISDSAITIGAKSGFLPSITYREFHSYMAKDDQHSFTEEHVPGKKIFTQKQSVR